VSEFDWETWLVEDAGYAVVEKKAGVGLNGLSPAERLTYCLWVADYGMRNAGDLEAAADVYPPFQTEGAQLAGELRLMQTAAIFASPRNEFQQNYFDRFDDMCHEIAGALGPPYQPVS
jgi:hypothetical protein